MNMLIRQIKGEVYRGLKKLRPAARGIDFEREWEGGEVTYITAAFNFGGSKQIPGIPA